MAPGRARALRPTRSTPDSFSNSGRPQTQMANPLTSHEYGSPMAALRDDFHALHGPQPTAMQTHPHLPAEDRFQAHDSFHSSLLQIGNEPSTTEGRQDEGAKLPKDGSAGDQGAQGPEDDAPGTKSLASLTL